MVVEFLVATACYTGKGCAESVAQYRLQTPELEAFIQGTEEQIKRKVPAILLDYVGPFAVLAVKKEASFRLTSNYSYKVASQFLGLQFNKNF